MNDEAANGGRKPGGSGAPRPGREGDLEPMALGHYDWGPEQAEESLRDVFERARAVGEGTVRWYLGQRVGKRRWAQLIRLFAILTAAGGGILPMIATLAGFNPVIATISVGAAAALVAVDRFFGFSSAWMRYLVTAMTIEKELESFQYDWEVQLATLGGDPPDQVTIRAMLSRCASFTKAVREAVEAETRAWSQEFSSTLAQLDAQVTTQAAQRATELKTWRTERERGAINVSVDGGAAAQGGWQLSIDGAPATTHTGETAAVEASPGLRKLLVVEAAGERRRAELAVTVPGGGSVSAKLKLA